MSFLLFLCYIFCIFIRPQDWVPGFYGKPLIYIFSLATIGLLLIEQASQRKLGLAKVPQNKLIFGLYFTIVMSHVANTYLGGAIFSLKSFLSIFIMFFLMLNVLNTETRFKTAIWFIIFLVVSLVAQGVYQLEHGYGWAGQVPTVTGGKFTELTLRINWIGIFHDPNDLALIFVIAAGLLMTFFIGRTSYFLRLFSLFLLCILLYGLWLTNSRGGLLSLMATVYFFFIRRTRKFVLGGIIGGILAFVALLYGPSRVSNISISEASAYGRVELWYQGIVMLKTHPLFGVGYEMFTDSLPQTAHNSYILAGAELGFIGLFFWMALIYSSYKGLMIIQNNVPKLYNYALGLQSSLVGFCAAAFFLSRTYVIIPYLLFALSGSLMHVASQRNPELNFDFTKKDFKITCWLSIGIILLSYVVIKVGL